MTLPVVQVGNPIKVIVYVKKTDGSVRDLTGASNLTIKLRSAVSRTGKTFSASFEGLPTSGAISCQLTEVTDIDSLETWKAQAYYTLEGRNYHTHPEEIFVAEGNLA